MTLITLTTSRTYENIFDVYTGYRQKNNNEKILYDIFNQYIIWYLPYYPYTWKSICSFVNILFIVNSYFCPCTLICVLLTKRVNEGIFFKWVKTFLFKTIKFDDVQNTNRTWLTKIGFLKWSCSLEIPSIVIKFQLIGASIKLCFW